MNNNAHSVKISVRNLVEFTLRSGDLDTRFTTSSRAVEGTRLHQKLQKLNKKKFAEMNMEYMSEVFLSYSFEREGISYIIEGRADGIIVPLENSLYKKITIDEIKTTSQPLEKIHEDYNELHWAQAKCYGYIYGLQQHLVDIDIQLTYCDVENEDVKVFVKNFSMDELESYFLNIIDKYHKWACLLEQWIDDRNLSIKSLVFPFASYRKGQRELAVSVYKTIREGRSIFVQAPTGIGKTISTIFPAVKAMGEGYVSKIFYLTAKTITRQVAEEAINKMRESNLSFKAITLTAKDKICFNKGSACNPEKCSYASGHFDRVNDAIEDILINENQLTRDKIEAYARKYSICPFEFSLDLTLWADCVICDYNYVFDPRVSLKRFFETRGDYAFLIDEAHNLVDRSREMYSAQLNKATFLKLKKLMKNIENSISKSLGKINDYFLTRKKVLEGKKFSKEKALPEDLYPLLKKFVKLSEDWLANNEGCEGHEDLLQLYFDVLSFLRVWELYSDDYITYVEDTGVDLIIKLFCLHPGKLLRQNINKGRAAVFFSATLTPMSYFKDILGGKEEDYFMRLPSPFPRERQCLLIADRVSTRYKDRDRSIGIITRYIYGLISAKKGNYMIFFPSYKYMLDVYNYFVEKYSEFKILLQQGDMNEDERDEFLKSFVEEPQETLIAFVVLGGIFSEGIDLKGDRLIGAAIVGVALPQLCLERDIIKDYFDELGQKGYDYAYTYPGMNKVMQAAGRVIRSLEDKGVVLLLDDRFSSYQYRPLFPENWQHARIVASPSELSNIVKHFWSEK
ncbi:MAG: ATP-dependent DNA helicase [Clostridiales bacterium]|uniref:ATP-dependent DNA helicase n=1 Tax=Clostridium sp. N3C TaxID=1776758 RepID=UPI000944C090|nr:ATP-dependent DNA helicase [Clostridiales bacterium]